MPGPVPDASRLADDPALRVVIDARVRPGEQGGVQQAIIGLAVGLGCMDGPERYFFLVEGDGDWLHPYLTGACQMVRARFPGPAIRRTIALGNAGRMQAGVALRYMAETRGSVLPPVDPAIRDLQPHVIHFMRHRGWRTTLPNVYVPHDIQHVDLPHFFPAMTRAYRRVVYRAMVAQATKLVALTAGQVARLATHYDIPADQIVVVPWASVLPHYPADASPPASVPGRFLLYPAQSWPHKNHLGLVEAIARLRRDGTDVPVVLTGGRDAHWKAVAAAIDELGVGDLLVHLGFVDDAIMRALYAAAVALVFPSFYEGFGLPVVEALQAGTPVVCADVQPVNELVGDAAVLFDPADSSAIAAAIASVWDSKAARVAMAQRGRQRIVGLSWGATAERYRALYRELAGRPTREDLNLLACPPPV